MVVSEVNEVEVGMGVDMDFRLIPGTVDKGKMAGLRIVTHLAGKSKRLSVPSSAVVGENGKFLCGQDNSLNAAGNEEKYGSIFHGF
jgi:hypothetical protein